MFSLGSKLTITISRWRSFIGQWTKHTRVSITYPYNTVFRITRFSRSKKKKNYSFSYFMLAGQFGFHRILRFLILNYIRLIEHITLLLFFWIRGVKIFWLTRIAQPQSSIAIFRISSCYLKFINWSRCYLLTYTNKRKIKLWPLPMTIFCEFILI